MNKRLTQVAMMNLGMGVAAAGTNYAYYGSPYFPKGRTQKTYKNKDANIEYYTDEKGNIRRKRKKVC